MKNKHLFAQLERLSDEETLGEKLNEEIGRSRAVGSIARNIIDNARLALDAQKSTRRYCERTPCNDGHRVQR